MKLLSITLAGSVIALCLATAAWRSQATAASARNEQAESEIARLSRRRDRARAEVECLRQPAAVRERRLKSEATIAKARAKPPKGSAPHVPKLSPSIAQVTE